MNHLLEPDLDRTGSSAPPDREISLGPATLLGIFFGLALLCAAFFGFGYSFGHRSAGSAAISPAAAPSASLVSMPKPAAGSAVLSAPPAPIVRTAAPAVTSTAASTVQTHNYAPSDAIIAGDRPRPVSPQAVPVSSASPAASGSAFMVQVAAVSTQDLADIEIAALRKDGYAVVVRHEPQDKLLHVQIGPYSDRRQAEAMRQRVIADGFNAIVK